MIVRFAHILDTEGENRYSRVAIRSQRLETGTIFGPASLNARRSRFLIRYHEVEVGSFEASLEFIGRSPSGKLRYCTKLNGNQLYRTASEGLMRFSYSMPLFTPPQRIAHMIGHTSCAPMPFLLTSNFQAEQVAHLTVSLYCHLPNNLIIADSRSIDV